MRYAAAAELLFYFIAEVMVDVEPTEDTHAVTALSVRSVGTHKCLYANVRGLRQAAGELAAMVDSVQPHFVFLTECHIGQDEPINTLVPYGYKVVVKRWRSKHGGGLLILSQEHLLCDPLNLKGFHIDEVAELVGMEYGGVKYVDAYCNRSSRCPQMVEVLQRLRDTWADEKVVIVGDFNLHNDEWLHSVSGTYKGGEMMEEFVQLQGLRQMVGFPTHEDVNTLDLVISDFDGTANATAHLGNSDHVSIVFELQVEQKVAMDAAQQPTRNWRRAPWHHIRGEVKRRTRD